MLCEQHRRECLYGRRDQVLGRHLRDLWQLGGTSLLQYSRHGRQRGNGPHLPRRHIGLQRYEYELDLRGVWRPRRPMLLGQQVRRQGMLLR